MSLVNVAHVCSHLQNASKVRLGLTSIPATKLHASLMLALQKQGFIASVTLGSTKPPLGWALQAPTPRKTSQNSHAFASVIQRKPWHAYPPIDPDRAKEYLEKLEKSAYMQNKAESAQGAAVESLAEQSTVDIMSEDLLAEDLIEEQTQPDEAAAISGPTVVLPEFEHKKTSKEGIFANIKVEGIPKNPAKRRLWIGLKYWDSEPVLSKMTLVSKPTKRITASWRELKKIVDGWSTKEIKGIVNPGECLLISTHIGILDIREAIEKRTGGMVVCRVS